MCILRNASRVTVSDTADIGVKSTRPAAVFAPEILAEPEFSPMRISK
jgi:hypothetical protein